jgi:hypothetical protein
MPATRVDEPLELPVVARPVLALVDDEAAESDARSPALAVGFWSRPQTLWAIVASFVLAAAATFVVQRAPASASPAETSATATAITHTTSAPVIVRAARTPETHEPAIPVVDVKSLPPVRRAPARAPTTRRPL